MTDHDNGLVCQEEFDTKLYGPEAEVQLKECYVNPKLSEIESFSFGGVCSRFQLYRKHMSSKRLNQIDKQPFKSWECLTISIG